jgi:elongation factor P hydroxylase
VPNLTQQERKGDDMAFADWVKRSMVAKYALGISKHPVDVRQALQAVYKAGQRDGQKNPKQTVKK